MKFNNSRKNVGIFVGLFVGLFFGLFVGLFVGGRGVADWGLGKRVRYCDSQNEVQRLTPWSWPRRFDFSTLDLHAFDED